MSKYYLIMKSNVTSSIHFTIFASEYIIMINKKKRKKNTNINGVKLKTIFF